MTSTDRSTLRDALREAGAAQSRGDPDAFDFGTRLWADFRKGQDWGSRQERVLDALRDAIDSRWFVCTPDADDFVAWPRMSSDTLEVPEGESAWTILNSAGIYLGNWIMYAADAPVVLDGMPDPFRDLVGLRRWLHDRPITAMLSSWPDLSDWVLVLRAGAAETSLRWPHRDS